MTKIQMIKAIELMKVNMQVCRKHAKVPAYALYIHKDELPMEWVREAWKWLKDIFDSDYQTYQQIRSLVSEDQWDRYEKWGGFNDHRHVQMFRDICILIRLRMISRNRPRFFKQSKVKAYERFQKTRKRK